MQQYNLPCLNNISGPNSPIFCEYETRIVNCEIHHSCYFGFGTYLNNSFVRSHTKIGRYCSIGRNVTIGSGTHNMKNITTSPYFTLSNELPLAAKNPNIRTLIGNDCWIGDYAYIMSGVTVGDGAVIGAHSVVTHDVEPYTIVVGSPAKKINIRFKEVLIEQLLQARWWEKSPLELRKLFTNNKSIDDIIRILPCLNYFPIEYIKKYR